MKEYNDYSLEVILVNNFHTIESYIDDWQKV